MCQGQRPPLHTGHVPGRDPNEGIPPAVRGVAVLATCHLATPYPTDTVWVLKGTDRVRTDDGWLRTGAAARASHPARGGHSAPSPGIPGSNPLACCQRNPTPLMTRLSRRRRALAWIPHATAVVPGWGGDAAAWLHFARPLPHRLWRGGLRRRQRPGPNPAPAPHHPARTHAYTHFNRHAFPLHMPQQLGC